MPQQTRLRKATYTAPRQSLAAKVIEYFKASPDEELARGDIAKRFDTQASVVASELADAVRARVLEHAQTDDGRVYRLHKGRRSRGSVPEPFASGAAAERAKWLAHRRGAAAVDPRKIKIERDVALAGPMRKSDAWDSLLAQMDEPGLSFSLPEVAKYSVLHAIADYRRRVNRSLRFAVRRINEDEYRVWRVA